MFYADIGSNPASAEAFQREHYALLSLDGHKNILELKDWGEHERSKRKFTVTPWIRHTISEFFDLSEQDAARLVFEELGRAFAQIEFGLEFFKNYFEEDEFVSRCLVEDDEDDEWLDEFDTFMVPILNGLVHAFDRKIIHRDLKPDNIFWEIKIDEKFEESVKFDEDSEESYELVVKLGDFGASKNWYLEGHKNATVANLYTEPWNPYPSEKEMMFQNTWDVFSWGVMAIALVADEKPKTFEDNKRILDTTFKDKVGENLHTYLSKVISLQPDERPQDVRQLQKDILKLNKERRKALGLE